MKKLFTFISLIVAVFAFGQNTFKTRLSTTYDNEFNKVIQLNDGSFVCVGYGPDSTYNQSVLLAKFNAQGTLITCKAIAAAAGYNEGTSAVKTADGGLAVTGAINGAMALLKFNASLTLQWAKQLTVSNAGTYGYGLIQTSDKGYMLVGKLYNQASSAAYLVKVDSTGKVVFSKRYFGFANNYVKDIATTADGNYALLAGTEDEQSNSDSTYLLKINSSGSIIWSRYINDSSLIQYPYTTIAATDGGIVIAGSAEKVYMIQGVPQRYDHMLMAKFNANGKMLWSKTIETTKPNAGYALAVTEDKDGGYIFGGEVYTYKRNGNADSSYMPFIKLSASGSLQWTKTLDDFKGDYYYSEPQHLIRTADGGYAVCGIGYYPNGNNDIAASFLYKLNANFTTCDGRNASLGKLANLGKGVAKAVAVNDVVTSSKNVSVKTTITGTPDYLCSAAAKIQQPLTNTILQNKIVNVHSDAISINPNPVQQNVHVQLQSATSNKATLQITDALPLPGTSYYRLKGVDKDGSFTYSSIASVTVNTNGTIIISPNPVQQNLHIQLQSTSSNKATLQITDITGKILSAQQTTITTGTNNITIPAASLSKGMYLLKVIQNDKTQAVKFIKE